MFQLCNKYERRLPREYYAEKVLATGDELYRAKVRERVVSYSPHTNRTIQLSKPTKKKTF